MCDRLPRFVLFALGVCALLASPARAYVIDFTSTSSRWTATATNPSTGSLGTPVTVTWSIAPDGTIMPGANSGLVGFLDTTFGAGPGGSNLTARPWYTFFNQATARIGQLSGVTYVYESNDDHAAFSGDNSARGVLGIRGDVRIGGKSYGPGNNTLAVSFFPNFSEIMINTDKGSYFSIDADNYRRFHNTLMHEMMHGLGVSHVVSSDALFLLNPSLPTTFDGPQLDDILALQRLYGDALEKNGGNDAANHATPLGAVSAGGSLLRGTLGDSTMVDGAAVDFLSIDDDSDVDYFSFSLAETLDVSLNLTPKGATYQMGPNAGSLTTFNAKALSDLSLALFDSSGVQQLATANANGSGFGESIARELTAGTYYARITGANDQVQLYQLGVTAAHVGPKDLTWAGLAVNTWDAGASANFNNGTSDAVFHDGDSVLFGDGVVATSITVPQQVAPASMRVSANAYRFSGPGGITVSGLTIDGGGGVTLANSGNILNGVDIRDGLLKISGSGNAPLAGTVRVAHGSVLQLVGTQAWAAASLLTGGGSVEGAVAMPGTIAPGDATETLTIHGSLTLENSSTVAIQLGGLVSGSNYDVLHVDGAAALDGLLAVTLVGGYQPAAGATFSIINASQILGAFDNISLPGLSPGLIWQTQSSSTQIVLSISSSVVYNPADFDENGIVDSGDLAAWRSWFGLTSGASHAQGDANGDLAVDAADLLIWQQNLNAGGGSAINSAPVPEPAAMFLALMALGGAIGARRRSQLFVARCGD